MDSIVIHGGLPLRGKVAVSGAKNAALPILAATLLASGKHVIHNVPAVQDVKTISKLLTTLGAQVTELGGGDVEVDTTGVERFQAPYELVKTMRASVLVLGPLLGRLGEARVSLPGGCAIGARPIDQHLKGLQALGARVELGGGGCQRFGTEAERDPCVSRYADRNRYREYHDGGCPGTRRNGN